MDRNVAEVRNSLEVTVKEKQEQRRVNHEKGEKWDHREMTTCALQAPFNHGV